MTAITLAPPIPPWVPFNAAQLEHRNAIQAALDGGQLVMERSVCFCGQSKGLVLSRHDCWGFAIPTIMCLSCLSLRSKYFFDDASMVKFYRDGFYRAHMFTSQSAGVGMNEAEYGREEENKGKTIYDWIERNADLHRVRTVLDVGCGVGGVLASFHARGHLVHGCDFVGEYIDHARRKVPAGDFRVGGLEQFRDGEKFDLVILSDVVEHLRAPLQMLQALQSFLHPRSQVFIIVPGVFGISNFRFHCSFRNFTKIEHTWCHTRRSLTLLMQMAGYELVTGSEAVFALYRPFSGGKPDFPGASHAILLLAFLASLPIRRALKLDRGLRAAKRLLRNR
jgi:SAM-dependent methyltransferase